MNLNITRTQTARAANRTATNNRKSNQGVQAAFLVLGMHQSGTSRLTTILEELGSQGPRNLLPANSSNIRGTFNSHALMALNDDILADLGTTWDGLTPLEDGWHTRAQCEVYRARIAVTLATEYGAAPLIHLKDPRLCRLLPLYSAALTEIGMSPRCILIHRNPAEVAHALETRTTAPIPQGTGALIWLRHVVDAEAASRDMRRIFTSDARMSADWREMATRAEIAFGFTWPTAETIGVGQLQAPPVSNSPPLTQSQPTLVREAYEVLERWAAQGEDASGRDSFDRIRSTLNAAMDLMASPLSTLSHHDRDVANELTRMKSKPTDQISPMNAPTATAETLQRSQTHAEKSKVVTCESAALLQPSPSPHHHDRATTLPTPIEESSAFGAIYADLLQKLMQAQESELQKEQEMAVFVAALIDRDRQLIQHRQAHGRLQDEIAKKKKELSASNDKIKILQKELADQKLRLKTEVQNSRTAARRAHVSEVDKIHQIYRQSTSWRITSPIRRISLLLKRQ